MFRLFRRGPTYWITGVYRGERFRVGTGLVVTEKAERYEEVLIALLEESEHLGVQVDPCGKLEHIAEILAKAWQRSPHKIRSS